MMITGEAGIKEGRDVNTGKERSRRAGVMIPGQRGVKEDRD